MKKKKKIIIVIILIIAIWAIYTLKFTETGNYVRWYMSAFDERKVETFEKYEKDFQIIADTIISKRKNGEIPKKHNHLYVEEGKMSSGNSINDIKNISLSESEKESLLKIIETFNDEDYPSAMLGVYDTYIYFPVAEYRLGLFYSETGSTFEDFGFSKDFESDSKIIKIKENWYGIEFKETK